LEVKAIEVLSDQRVGQGGVLVLRRMRLRLLRRDGSQTKEGTWDYVERAMGLDAVVVALWRRRGAVEVLLRWGIRVPLQFGRPDPPSGLLFPELVAGILEAGEESEEALRKRAADEAMEEAGLRLSPASVERLGPPLFPTPGMCAEQFHFVSCEVGDGAAAVPQGDGSPFEEGARLEWVELDEALRRCARGEIQDLKTELALRRLQQKLGEVSEDIHR
jgi:ADP-ribose pyrophosphatase